MTLDWVLGIDIQAIKRRNKISVLKQSLLIEFIQKSTLPWIQSRLSDVKEFLFVHPSQSIYYVSGKILGTTGGQKYIKQDQSSKGDYVTV